MKIASSRFASATDSFSFVKKGMWRKWTHQVSKNDLQTSFCTVSSSFKFFFQLPIFLRGFLEELKRKIRFRKLVSTPLIIHRLGVTWHLWNSRSCALFEKRITAHKVMECDIEKSGIDIHWPRLENQDHQRSYFSCQAY